MKKRFKINNSIRPDIFRDNNWTTNLLNTINNQKLKIAANSDSWPTVIKLLVVSQPWGRWTLSAKYEALRLGSHQCNNFHCFYPSDENIRAMIFKNYCSISVISQSDNYQIFLIFITLKYLSDILVQRNTDHGLYWICKVLFVFYWKNHFLCKDKVIEKLLKCC